MGGAATSFEPGLASIIGMQSVLDRLTIGVVAPLVAARAGELMARPPTGVLLYGAPGCGVETIARALVAELNDFGARSVGDVDGRVEVPGPSDWRREVLVGWSHRPWELPNTAVEAGRFELLVFVPPPDWEARRFRVWETAARRGVPSADLDSLVVATEGWSGRDIDVLLDQSTDVDELLDLVPLHPPSTWRWMLQVRGALDGPLAGGADDLRIHLDRYRLG